MPSGMDNGAMSSGGVDELGRIQNLLDDGNEFEQIESDGLQMEMGVDAFGDVNLLNLGGNQGL